MNKKGFSLLEMLAVIVAITIITLLVVPNILNMVNNKRSDISDTAKQMVYDATELYVKENSSSYPTTANAVYCIKLETLVNNGKLTAPVKDLKKDKEIPLNYYVKTTINGHSQYEYELVDNTHCTPTIAYYVTDADVNAEEKTITIKYPQNNYIKKYKILSGTVSGDTPINTDITVTTNVSVTFTSNGSIKFWVEDEGGTVAEKTVNINKITN